MKSPTLKEHLEARTVLLAEYREREKEVLDEARELYYLENETRPEGMTEERWGYDSIHGPGILQQMFLNKLRQSEKFMPLFARDYMDWQRFLWDDLPDIYTSASFRKEHFIIPVGMPVIVRGGLVNALPGTIAVKAPNPNPVHYHYQSSVFLLPVWRPGFGILKFNTSKNSDHTYEPVCGLDEESKQDLEVAYIAYLDYLRKNPELNGI